MDFCNVNYVIGNSKYDQSLIELVIRPVIDHGYEWRDRLKGEGYVSWYYSPGMKEPLRDIKLQDAVDLALKTNAFSLRFCKEWWGFLDLEFGRALNRKPSRFGILSASTFSAFFDRNQEGNGDKESKQFVGLCRDLCIQANSIYACGDVEDTEGERIRLPGDDDLVAGRVGKVHWLNFFGPELASAIGRRLLMTAKWEKTESLENGGVLALAYLNPKEDLLAGGLEKIKVIESQLGIHQTGS